MKLVTERAGKVYVKVEVPLVIVEVTGCTPVSLQFADVICQTEAWLLGVKPFKLRVVVCGSVLLLVTIRYRWLLSSLIVA
jgi:hypothetical protein